MLLVLCGLGIVALLVNPGRYVDHVSGLFLLLVFFSQIVLFARRVKITQPQAFYLYFDRYLFSVAMPAGLLLAAIGLHMTIGAIERVTAARPRRAQIAVAAVLVVALLALIPQIDETRRVTRYPLFGNSYHALNRLDSLTLVNGPGTIVYSGQSHPPAELVLPEHLPAVRAAARTVVQPQGDRHPDRIRQTGKGLAGASEGVRARQAVRPQGGAVTAEDRRADLRLPR